MTGARAVVFDMDGVLVHTTALHTEIWTDWFAAVPYDPGPGGIPGVMGRRGEDVVAEVMGAEGDPGTAAAVVGGLYDTMLERLAAAPLPFAPGVETLLDGLASAGVPCALATSGRRDAVDALVGQLVERFAAVVTAEDVTRGKPDPEVYETAAARLGVPATACVVVEDAVPGVAAARAAGMRVVAVTSTADRSVLAAAGADPVVGGLDDLAVADLLGAPSDRLPPPLPGDGPRRARRGAPWPAQT